MTTRRRSETPEDTGTSRARRAATHPGARQVKVRAGILPALLTLLTLVLIGGPGCGDGDDPLSPEIGPSGLLPPQIASPDGESRFALARIAFTDRSRIDFEVVDDLIVVSSAGPADAEAFRSGIDGREQVDPVTLYESLTGKSAPPALVAAVRDGVPPASSPETEVTAVSITDGDIPLATESVSHDVAPAFAGARSGSCGSDAFQTNHCRNSYDFQFCFPSVQHNYRREELATYARAIVQPYSGRVTMTFQYQSGGTWRTKVINDIDTCDSFTSYVSVWEFGGGGLTIAIPMRVLVDWSSGDRYGVSFFGYR